MKGVAVMGKRRVQWFLVLMLVVVVASMVTACGDSTPPETETTQAVETETTQATSEDEVIELVLAHKYTPPNTYALAYEKWLDYVQTESNGRIKIVPYWGETLIGGDETIAELKAGTADMAFAALYTNLGYEITSALPLFLYGSPSADVNYRVSLEIFDKYPQYQQEFAGLSTAGLSQCPTVLSDKQ